MKNLIATLTCLALLTIPALADCGSCGSVAKHSHDKTIVSVAKDAGTFQTLLQAAEAAGLVETLTSDGPFTVFAPTDEAFANLPEGTLESLLADKDKLKAVLLYHVVPGKKMAADVVSVDSLKSAQGSSIEVVTKDGNVMVDNAQVVKTDIDAGNGVIHVIDAVIVPK